MRKYIRSMARAEGTKRKLKASRYVKAVWERLSQKKYGVEQRHRNQAKGTHKRYLWDSRIMGGAQSYERVYKEM